MKKLTKGLLCAVSVVSLGLSDAAMAAAQMQPERPMNERASRRAQARPVQPTRQRQARPAPRTTTRTTVTRPARTTTRTTVRRPARTTTRTTVTRPTRITTRTVSTRSRTRFPTFRPGSRPTTFHRIRATAFRYPRGFHYRRFRIGLILPSIFLSSAFFFNDPFLLGLGPPPPGYVWVRFGPDLLLVNRYTGRIVDVIYGAFY